MAETGLSQPLLSSDNDFKLRISLISRGSNLVQAAFGYDADSDGSLSLDETSWIAGYACGSLFIRSNGLKTRTEFRVPPDIRNLTLRVRHDSETFLPAEIRLNGISIKPGDSMWSDAIRGFAPQNWNMVRVTRRGGGISIQDASVITTPDPGVILVR